MKIDLHTHSNSSDGTLAPRDMVTLALREGISCIALCDHDTTEGIDEFKAAAQGTELCAIGGIELSVSWNTGTCHIIGLDFDIKNQELQYILTTVRGARDKRNHAIIAKLNNLGINIDIESVKKRSLGKVIGRPHIASVLVEKQVSASIQEAFVNYLQKGARAYVPRYQIDPVTAICALKKAGAVTILAHPVQLNIPDDECRMFLKQLKDFGLDALEVYTPHHTPVRVNDFLRMAQDLDLGVSGGSDFHGMYKPERRLGMYSDYQDIPYSVHSVLTLRRT
jgi:predicted metal-dependent phosphoesterase TrpH